MTEPILFYREYNLNGELSNYYNKLSAHLKYENASYASSEHLYQSLKFVYPGASPETLEYAEKVRLAKTPNQARVLAMLKTGGGYKWRTDLNEPIRTALAKGVKMNPDWENQKADCMRMVLRIKFNQDSHCAQVLLATKDCPLVEDSPFDAFWGIGKNKNGLNMLGKLLMEIRDEIKHQPKQNKLDLVQRPAAEIKRRRVGEEIE